MQRERALALGNVQRDILERACFQKALCGVSSSSHDKMCKSNLSACSFTDCHRRREAGDKASKGSNYEAMLALQKPIPIEVRVVRTFACAHCQTPQEAHTVPILQLHNSLLAQIPHRPPPPSSLQQEDVIPATEDELTRRRGQALRSYLENELGAERANLMALLAKHGVLMKVSSIHIPFYPRRRNTHIRSPSTIPCPCHAPPTRQNELTFVIIRQGSLTSSHLSSHIPLRSSASCVLPQGGPGEATAFMDELLLWRAEGVVAGVGSEDGGADGGK